MRKKIRIIERKRKRRFTELLERKASELVKTGPSGQGSLASLDPRGEIALTLSHLNSVRRVHGELRRKLLRLETYIDTEIMQRTPRRPVYQDHRLPERDMLRARLLQIESERRKLAIMEEKEQRELHGRLWGLLQQHAQFKTLRWKSTG